MALIPLQGSEIASGIKQLTTIETVTNYGLFFVIIAGLTWYIVFLIRENKRKEQADREQEKETIKVISNLTNQLSNGNSQTKEVSSKLNDVNSKVTELLVYVKMDKN